MSTLANSAARGAALTMIGQLTRLAVQMVTLVLIARLLAPSEIGIIAMVTAIVGIGELVRDLGLSNASIQTKILTKRQRDNLFWLSSVIGIAIGVTIALGSPLIAALYGEGALRAVALTLSLTFVFNGFAAQHKASLARALRFRALMFVETIPPILGSATAIVLATVGWSYWALVMQQITQTFMALVMVLIIAAWLPGLPRRTEGMRPLISYGVNLLGAQIVAYASRNIDTIVSGLRFGPGLTGLYSRSFDLVVNPLNQISAPSSRVAMPILSRLQDDEERYNAFLIRGQKLMLIAIVPVFALAIAVANPLITLLLGEHWRGAIPLFQILAVAGIIRACGYPTYWVALSRGATKISFYVNLVCTPIFFVSIIIGSLIGIEGIAWGFTIGTTATWLISLVWYRNSVAAPSRGLFYGALRIIAFAAPATVLSWVATILASQLGAAASLLIGSATFLVAYAITALLAKPLRADFRLAVSTVRLIRKR